MLAPLFSQGEFADTESDLVRKMLLVDHDDGPTIDDRDALYASHYAKLASERAALLAL
jgi:hypothetical protein